MRPYALIDLHCDTLTDCMYAGSNIIDTLDDPARTLSLTSIPKDIHWAQFFAVFVPDELRGEKAIRFFDDACANFDRQMRKFADLVSPCRNVADMERAWAAGKTAAFLSVENGSAFAGDLSRIGKIKVRPDQKLLIEGDLSSYAVRLETIKSWIGKINRL